MLNNYILLIINKNKRENTNENINNILLVTLALMSHPEPPENFTFI